MMEATYASVRLSRDSRVSSDKSVHALVAGLFVWLAVTWIPAYAQEGEEIANWAFATWIGTGVYRLEDRELTVFRVPIAFGVPGNEARKFKLKVLLPVTLGVENFEFDIDNPQIPERLETITFVPGAEVEVPILKNWSLKPFGQAGIGKDFSGGDFVYLYSIGLKSLATFPWRKYTFGLGNRVMGAGQTVSGGGNSKGFALWEVGLDTHLPGSIRMFKRNLDFSVFIIHTQFTNAVDFLAPIGEQPVELTRLTHVGFTVGPDKRLKIWKGFDIPRVGVGYMWGDADFSGIRFNAGFPF